MEVQIHSILMSALDESEGYLSPPGPDYPRYVVNINVDLLV